MRKHGKRFRNLTSAFDRDALYAPDEAAAIVKRNANAKFDETVEITVFEDRTFTFITKTPPASFLIKRALGLESGSKEPNRNKVGKLTEAQVREIAQAKMPDLNANDIDAAMKIVAGTARSMGVEVG